MQVGNAVPPLLARAAALRFPPGAAADLFAGVGGLTHGLRLAGHDVRIAVDNNQWALRAHEQNDDAIAWNADLSTEDGRQDTWSAIDKTANGELSLLAGGPPCQGFSNAGNALSDDPRNRLVMAFLDGVRQLEPPYLLLENVAALAQKRGQAVMKELLSILRTLNYRVEVNILHSEIYGVPQRRRRVFVTAARAGAEMYPYPPGSFRAEAPAFTREQPLPIGTDRGFSVRDAIADLPAIEAGSLEEKVHLEAPVSTFQRWARGEIHADDLY